MNLYPLFKKKFLFLWVKKSWSALLFIFIYSIFMIYALEPLVKKITPPEKPEKKTILGIIEIEKKPSGSSKAVRIQKQISPWLWTLGGIIFIVITAKKFKESLKDSEEYRKALESAASKSLQENEISKGINLLKKAIDYSTDPEISYTLSRKLSEVEQYSLTYTKGDGKLREKIMEVSATLINSNSEKEPLLLENGRLKILCLLGSGGMGKVFLAEHTILHRKVAVKELAPHLLSNPDLVKRFEREGQALARLSHSNIVQVYDFFEENGKNYLVMEYVDGKSLDEVIKGDGIKSIDVLKDYALQMARGLEYAHSKAIVHRDLKPHNILLSKDGVIKIADFGLARLLDVTIYTVPGTVIGSPLYMSPEQADGREADFRSDIYSYGIILYEMATGHCPFIGNSSEVIAQHLSKKPESPRKFNARIPPHIEKLILKCIEKKPEERYQNMSEIIQELLKI